MADEKRHPRKSAVPGRRGGAEPPRPEEKRHHAEERATAEQRAETPLERPKSAPEPPRAGAESPQAKAERPEGGAQVTASEGSGSAEALIKLLTDAETRQAFAADPLATIEKLGVELDESQRQLILDAATTYAESIDAEQGGGAPARMAAAMQVQPLIACLDPYALAAQEEMAALQQAQLWALPPWTFPRPMSRLSSGWPRSMR